MINESEILPLQDNPLQDNNNAEIENLLLEHFTPIYKNRVKDYVQSILSTEHYGDRYNYLRSIIGSKSFKADSSILLSGFSVGSEMLVARQYGFGRIDGVEVDKFLVSIAQKRLQSFPEMHPIYYDGNFLPYSDNQFDLVISGHIIEHTNSPKDYLHECIRVLASGGYLFLEFPHRYHRKELHTQLFSFEWMPRFIRNALILLISSKYSPLGEETKLKYQSIVTTNLQQISMWQIKRMLKNLIFSATVIHSSEVSPGIIRCVIQRDDN